MLWLWISMVLAWSQLLHVRIKNPSMDILATVRIQPGKNLQSCGIYKVEVCIFFVLSSILIQSFIFIMEKQRNVYHLD